MLNVDFQKYRILGTSNPPFAYQALQVEDITGTVLRCSSWIRAQVASHCSPLISALRVR